MSREVLINLANKGSSFIKGGLLLNRRGFSLIGVLTASVIGVIVVLGVSQLSTDVMKLSQRATVQFEMVDLVNEIRVLLRDSDSCVETFSRVRLEHDGSNKYDFKSGTGTNIDEGGLQIKGKDEGSTSPLTRYKVGCYETGVSSGSNCAGVGSIKILKAEFADSDSGQKEIKHLKLFLGHQGKNEVVAGKPQIIKIQVLELEGSGSNTGKITKCMALGGSGGEGGKSAECYEVIGDENDPLFGQHKISCEKDSPTNVMKQKLVAFGLNAGKNNTGSSNTFIGNEAGASNTSGSQNVFIGTGAGLSNGWQSENTFIGYQAGYSSTYGNKHTFIGYQAGYNNKQSSECTFIGYQAGYNNKQGGKGTLIGYQAGYEKERNVGTFVGYKAGYKSGGGTFIGSQAGYNTTDGGGTFIGYQAGYRNTTGGGTFIGSLAGYNNTDGRGNTFIGSLAGKETKTDGGLKGDKNTFIGSQAGYRNTTGGSNTFIGYQVGNSNTTGLHNTFIGYQAGSNNKVGTHNILIGSQTGASKPATFFNVLIGHRAGHRNSGNYNTFIGNRAGHNNESGGGNIYIGHESGCIDYDEGFIRDTCKKSSHNIYIGAGFQATADEDQRDYKLNIGNLITGDGVRDGSITDSPPETGDPFPSDPSVTIHGNLFVKGDISLDSGKEYKINNIAHSHTPSDKRLKTKIKPLKDSFLRLLKLQPKTFYWKDKTKSQEKQFGFIAQDIKKDFPNLVSEDLSPKKILSLNYIGFIPIIIKSLKEFYDFVLKELESLNQTVHSYSEKIQKEVRDLKISLFKEVSDLKTSLLATQKEIKILLAQEVKNIKQSLFENKVHITKNQTKLTKVEANLSKTQVDLIGHKVLIYKNQIDLTRTQRNLSKTKEDFRRELSSLKKENETLSKKLGSVKKENQELRKKMNEIEKYFKLIQKKHPPTPSPK